MNASTDAAIRSLNRSKAVAAIASYNALLRVARPDEAPFLARLIKAHQATIDTCDAMREAGY